MRLIVFSSFLLLMFRVCLCNTVLPVPCSLVVTCWQRANLEVFLCQVVCDVFFCFVTLPCGFLGRVWCLIVSIPAFCLLSYFILMQTDCKLQSIAVVYSTFNTLAYIPTYHFLIIISQLQNTVLHFNHALYQM